MAKDLRHDIRDDESVKDCRRHGMAAGKAVSRNGNKWIDERGSRPMNENFERVVECVAAKHQRDQWRKATITASGDEHQADHGSRAGKCGGRTQKTYNDHRAGQRRHGVRMQPMGNDCIVGYDPASTSYALCEPRKCSQRNQKCQRSCNQVAMDRQTPSDWRCSHVVDCRRTDLSM